MLERNEIALYLEILRGVKGVERIHAHAQRDQLVEYVPITL